MRKNNIAKASWRMLAGLAVFAMLTGCKDENGGGKNTPYMPIELTRSQQEVVATTNRLAYSLLEKTCVDGEDNMFESPLSLTTALAMLANGAQGETQRQLLDALEAENLDELNNTFSILSSRLPSADGRVRLSIANSLWVGNNFPILPEYQLILKDYYNAEAFNIELHSKKAMDQINQWCSDKTEGLINPFLEFPPEWPVNLVNAVYFKGQWANMFKDHDTRLFTCASGRKKRMEMMRQMYDDLSRSFDKWSETARLPYGNGAFYMEISLPNEGMTPEELLAIRASGQTDPEAQDIIDSNITVTMPKFKIETEVDFVGALKALGVTDAFDSSRADFSRIATGPLYFNTVFQKSYVIVNEEGTEAASATHVGGCTSPGPGDPFTVDRPFIFSIREKSSDAILFLGIVRTL